MRSVTIDDVARQAGVSIKTVSRVVNREPNVRPATREKVEAAIADLNYRPNPSARGLAGRRSYLIGLLYDNPSPNYLARLHAGLLEACEPAHYGLALFPASYNDPDLVDHVRGWLRQAQIDGVVVTPPLSDCAPLVDAIIERGVPVIVVSSEGPGNVPAVVIDEEQAAHDMTSHLIGLGHGRIGYIGGHPDHYASKQREAGFERAMAEAGQQVSPELKAQGYFDFESGRAAAGKLLSLGNPPSAIFAANDDMAAGVVFEAHERGLSVPGDLAVAGFDDTPLASQVWPGLTTVRQPIRSIGRLAGEELLSAIGGGDSSAQEFVKGSLGFELKIRGSTSRAISKG